MDLAEAAFKYQDAAIRKIMGSGATASTCYR
jgi:hypothetical protein